MVINKSVLGKAPFSVSLTVVGLTIILLFTIVEPEASAGLTLWPRLLFWTAQISISLLGILIASFLIRRLMTTAISDIWLVLITGVIASIVVSPAFIVIESLFPSLDRLPDSALDEFALAGVLPAIFVQSLETIPILSTVWILVNLPILLSSTFINHNGESGPDNEPPNTNKTSDDSHLDKEALKQESAQAQFYQKLPANIGTSIMYVSSDLHYLHVTTERGTVLILGSIAKFSEAFEDEGFLVHRSHWVNKTFVERVIVSGQHSQCEMRDKKRIPISRSKRKLLKAYFGSGSATKQNIVELNSQKENS